MRCTITHIYRYVHKQNVLVFSSLTREVGRARRLHRGSGPGAPPGPMLAYPSAGLGDSGSIPLYLVLGCILETAALETKQRDSGLPPRLPPNVQINAREIKLEMTGWVLLHGTGLEGTAEVRPAVALTLADGSLCSSGDVGRALAPHARLLRAALLVFGAGLRGRGGGAYAREYSGVFQVRSATPTCYASSAEH